MIITKTPFRISFFGGGSDMKSFYKYYTGKVISTTIDKYIYVIVKKQLGIVEFKYRVNWSQTEFKNRLDEIKHPIVRETLRYFKIDYPIEITTFSDIPANTGLASSSAFAVGLVHALLILQQKKFSKNLIAKIASHIEVEVLKRNIGKQDHYACAFGGFNQINFYKNESVKVTKIKYNKKKVNDLEKNLQLYYTSIKRNASSILKNQSKLSKKQKVNLLKLTGLVNTAKNLLIDKKSKLTDFGKLLHKGWEIKREINKRTSNKNINNFYFNAINSGALGGKILGAGNGGFFLFFVNEKKKRHLEKKLKNLKKLNFNFDQKGTQKSYYDKKYKSI